MSLKQPAPGYMVQLDGLRAIAVTIVILFHWTPEVKQTGLGGLGVQLFFVLSGYLITGILLNARDKAEALGAGKGQILKSFYARRFLRIFPPYYLTIGITTALGAYNMLEYLPWHLLYLTNIAIFIEGAWIGEASHLWSLAVEEQFYLLWPFVILFTPRRYLAITIAGFIVLAPAFKLTCLLLDIGGSRLGVLPVSSFHYLGAGAMLALLQKSNKFKLDAAWRQTIAVRVQWAGIAGLAVFAGLQFFPELLRWHAAVPIVQEFALICLFTSLTMGAAQGFRGFGGVVLASKPMVYIGQISYGLYLFHNFVPYFVNKALREFKLTGALSTGQLLLFYGGVLLLISALSWHFFERRLNRYKDSFPYIKQTQKPDVIVAN